ncbi:MAG: gamma-glutamyltransferase [Parvibaculum sedimenti]|uniref:gamma-glutamyltransferase n=1 Tax=Parvibaculum sedimenti TaxID=2608632 RepID=UPI003BB64A31
MPLKRILPVIVAAILVVAISLWWTFGQGTRHSYMVAAANPYASEAGAQILKRGGSAVDAAIAIQAVLTLVEPESSGLAGGAFMLHWAPRTGKLDAYDGRETAPAGATPDMFLDAQKKPLGIRDAVLSGRSVGTPGVVRMLWLAHEKYGKLPWADLFKPAIKLATEGFKISPKLAATIKRDTALPSMPVVQDYFYSKDASGNRVPLAAGAMLKNPELAETLKLIAAKGPDGFYAGPVAQKIVDAVTHAPALPGTLSLADLSAYQAKEREPLCRAYRDYRVCTMPPPTSGGITTLQILGILENFDMGQIEPMSLPAVHFIAEAEKLAYADRAKFIGDPDYVHVPVDAMLDASYLHKRAGTIDPSRSMGRANPGEIDDQRADAYGINADIARPSTSHFSIYDPDGNVVSMTTSIEAPFGSHLMAAGMMLNNQLTDFSLVPEVNGAPVANAVAPGKRPMSAMDPVIVFDKGGDFFAAVGSPGGSRIIGYVTETLIGLLDWNMNMQTAIALPRFVDRNGALEIEKGTDLEKLTPQLQQLGHEVMPVELKSGLHGIRLTSLGLDGGADPRRNGTVVEGAR